MDAEVVHKVAPGVAGALAVAVMLLLLKSRRLPLDRPNHRSLHSVAVPRTGGMAIMSGVVASALLLGTEMDIIGLAAALAVLSYLDDRHPLPAPVRLAAHLIAAAAFVWMAGGFGQPLTAVALILAVCWVTNLYNFMDGSDGLAGGMAVLGFLSYGIAARLAGLEALALLSWSIATASAGFLIFNFPPARIFMGDVGSIPLGFLAGAIGVRGVQQSAWPAWFPLLVFAPFIVDASVTLVRRASRGEPVWRAHRQHYYQRLILSGWSHRRTAVCAYALMLACSALAILSVHASPAVQSAAIGVVAAAFVALMWAIDRRWRQFSAGAHD